VISLTTKMTGKLLGETQPNRSPLGGGAEEFPVSDVTDFEAPTQDDMKFDLRALFQAAIKASLEILLEEEIKLRVGGSRWACWPATSNVRRR
jgi:hypothetical protein